MRLSISARIFSGFLVVLITFGGVMGYTFHRMHRLQEDLQLINKSYLQLTLTLAELYTIQDNLLNVVAERSAWRRTSNLLRPHVHLARLYRLRDIQAALKVIKKSQSLKLSRRDQQFMKRTEQRLKNLEQAFQANDMLFEQLFSSTLHPDLTTNDELRERLLKLESKLALQIRELRDDLRGQVKAAAIHVEQDENHAVWALLVLVVVALLVSVVVTVGAQLTLHPLKKLVAGTQRIGSGDYSHRVNISSRDELGMLAQEFNNMARAIEEREQRLIRSERMAAAGQIASHITHEIRNPLSSISLNTELLEEELEALDGQKLSEARHLCQAMRREVDRLTEITEEYLRFSRLPRPQLESENVNEIILNLLSFMSNELREKKIEVIYNLQEELPAIEADENQLRQAFLNLVRNAGEALSLDGGTIKVSTYLEQDCVVVQIADTGPGINQQDLPKIFEPFFSTKEKGTGLGLALTQQIIQEHGGIIGVESILPHGTTFMIRLPVQGAPEKIEHLSG